MKNRRSRAKGPQKFPTLSELERAAERSTVRSEAPAEAGTALRGQERPDPGQLRARLLRLTPETGNFPVEGGSRHDRGSKISCFGEVADA
jgi:hypothetical protein